MTDYTKNSVFANLTGVIDGADWDSEFDEIVTAIASKENIASKGAANGYAGLDAGGLVAASDLPDASTTAEGIVELATSAETITGTDTARVVTPAGLKAVLDQNGGLLTDLTALTDPGADRILFWDESSNLITYLTVSTGLAISGTSLLVSAIPETSISDGTVLARVAGTETITGTWTVSGTWSISGAWTFSTRPKFTSQGGFLNNASSSNTGGKITLSNTEPASAAAIGSAGDYVFEY